MTVKGERIVGFCRQSIIVNRNVMAPRHKTQVTARVAVAATNQMATEHRTITVLDVGTGSGAIILVVAKETEDSNMKIEYLACDISVEALQVARRNADHLKKANVVEFFQSDLLTSIPTVPDVIIANLPYVPDGQEPPELAREEPRCAVFDTGDGTEILDKLCTQIDQLQRKGNGPKRLIFETDPNLVERSMDIIRLRFRNHPSSVVVHADQNLDLRTVEVSWT